MPGPGLEGTKDFDFPIWIAQLIVQVQGQLIPITTDLDLVGRETDGHPPIRPRESW
jgi:hypothetical protein